MSEVLSLLSLFLEALSSEPGAPPPLPVASRHPHSHQGALLHTWAPSSTQRRSPPHRSALIHTRALSSLPGSPTLHQGALLHTRALSSTPGRSPPHHGALLHTKKPYTTPERPITQHGVLLCTTGALLRTRGIFLCGRGALLRNRGASSKLLTKVSSSTSSDALVTRGLTTAFPLSISGQPSPHQRTPRPSSMMHHPQTGATSS